MALDVWRECMRKGYHKKYKKYCRQLGITLEEGKESCQEILIDWEHHVLFCTYLNLYYIPYLVVYNKENPFEATKCCRLSLVSNEYINLYPKSRLTQWKFKDYELVTIISIMETYWEDIQYFFSVKYLENYGYCRYIPLCCPYSGKIINEVDRNIAFHKNVDSLETIKESEFKCMISIG